MTKFFVRGVPGVGKTTLISDIVETLESSHPGAVGFHTAEFRDAAGRRQGFVLKTSWGSEQILARKPSKIEVSRESKVIMVGAYEVNLTVMPRVVKQLDREIRHSNPHLIYIDELASMEFTCVDFARFVKTLITSPDTNILASISQRTPLERLSIRKDDVYDLTRENYPLIKEQALKVFQ